MRFGNDSEDEKHEGEAGDSLKGGRPRSAVLNKGPTPHPDLVTISNVGAN
jgi:hypothetical protein